METRIFLASIFALIAPSTVKSQDNVERIGPGPATGNILLL